MILTKQLVENGHKEAPSSYEAQTTEAHQSYLEKALGRCFSSLLSSLPSSEREELVGKLFFKVAELEKLKLILLNYFFLLITAPLMK